LQGLDKKHVDKDN